MKETLGITELRTWKESRDLFASCNSAEHWATMNSCSFLNLSKGRNWKGNWGRREDKELTLRWGSVLGESPCEEART